MKPKRQTRERSQSELTCSSQATVRQRKRLIPALSSPKPTGSPSQHTSSCSKAKHGTFPKSQAETGPAAPFWCPVEVLCHLSKPRPHPSSSRGSVGLPFSVLVSSSHLEADLLACLWARDSHLLQAGSNLLSIYSLQSAPQTHSRCSASTGRPVGADTGHTPSRRAQAASTAHLGTQGLFPTSPADSGAFVC